MGISEVKVREKGAEVIFEAIVSENFPNERQTPNKGFKFGSTMQYKILPIPPSHFPPTKPKPKLIIIYR